MFSTPAGPRCSEKVTEKPLSIALAPRATLRCVFPTPGGPCIRSVSFARTQAQVPSVSMWDRSTEGWSRTGLGLASSATRPSACSTGFGGNPESK